ncbi:hypothetical protein Leryth_023400 [Lithospermum erythrorhizon]|nr:hypothetical protein Leryth_023400 [Lithospermum erythrorhizon]
MYCLSETPTHHCCFLSLSLFDLLFFEFGLLILVFVLY